MQATLMRDMATVLMASVAYARGLEELPETFQVEPVTDEEQATGSPGPRVFGKRPAPTTTEE